MPERILNRSRRLYIFVSVYALAVAIALALPSAAWAHVKLESATPAAGARLTVLPRSLRLVFTEALELAVSSIELRDTDGALVRLGSIANPPDSASILIAAVEGPLAAGTYTVTWRVMGDDGHPVTGQFPFTITTEAVEASSSQVMPLVSDESGSAPTELDRMIPPTVQRTSPASSGFDSSSPLYVAIRWLLYAGLLTVLGAVAFHYLVLGGVRRLWSVSDSPTGASKGAIPISVGDGTGTGTAMSVADRQAARVGLMATALVLGSAVLRLAAQSYAVGGAEPWSGSLLTAMLGRTLWGWGWLLQVAAVVVASVGFSLSARTTNSRLGMPSGRAGAWALAAAGAILLAFTPALSGHAASSPRLVPLAMFADGLHVIGAAGWLGTLLLTVAVGIPAALRLPESNRGRAVADLFNAFSPIALVFAALTAVTGLFATWLHVGNIGALWQTDYGRTLLVKLALLSLVAMTGAYNWLRVRPSLGNLAGVTRIRRSASVEITVGVLVLIATAVLVATPTATDLQTPASAATSAARY